MKNPESHINKTFTVEDLLTPGWTLTLIERFLEPEDDRNPVDHFRNYAGKKMYQRRRVELTEASGRATSETSGNGNAGLQRVKFSYERFEAAKFSIIHLLDEFRSLMNVSRS